MWIAFFAIRNNFRQKWHNFSKIENRKETSRNGDKSLGHCREAAQGGKSYKRMKMIVCTGSPSFSGNHLRHLRLCGNWNGCCNIVEPSADSSALRCFRKYFTGFVWVYGSKQAGLAAMMSPKGHEVVNGANRVSGWVGQQESSVVSRTQMYFVFFDGCTSSEMWEAILCLWGYVLSISHRGLHAISNYWWWHM